MEIHYSNRLLRSLQVLKFWLLRAACFALPWFRAAQMVVVSNLSLSSCCFDVHSLLWNTSSCKLYFAYFQRNFSPGYHEKRASEEARQALAPQNSKPA
jgi:hypothetical protein